MNEELKNALLEVKEGLEKKTKDQLATMVADLESKFEGVPTEEEVKDLQTTLDEMKSHNEALQKHLDELDIAVQQKGEKDLKDMHPVAAYYKAMTEAIEEKGDEISKVRKGHGFEMEVKAPMLLSTNLTGDPVKTYDESVKEIPFQRVNFADLVPNISSRTGVYTYYVENAPTGAAATQTEGADKAEIEFNLTETICNAAYIAGYTRVSKQMMQDLPFLMSFLPRALRREYFKAENASFENTLTTAATGTSTGAGGVTGIIEDIGVLEADDYEVTGIVMNPADWASLAAAAIPGNTQSAIVSFVNNQMFIAGVPVFKASWVTAGEYILGDWFWAKKIVVDGLSVEFFEQDQDNVIKNLVTVKVESRTCLAVEKPAAFLVGLVAGT